MALVSILVCVFSLSVLSLSVDSAESGIYSFERSFSLFRKCPDTISIGESDNSVLPADHIIIDNIDVCRGNPITFTDQSIPEQFGILDFSQGKVDGTLRCGELEIDDGTQFYFLQFKGRTALADLPAQVIDDTSPSPTTNPSTSASPSPPAFFFSPNTFYLISTDSCVWKRTSSSAGSPIDPTVQPSSDVLGDTEEEQDDDDNDANSSSEPNGPLCFPSTAIITLRDGSAVQISELQVGDVVHTGYGKYESVFAWTHQQPISSKTYTYVNLHTKLQKPLVLTPSHFIPKHDGEVVPAGDIQVGDNLIGHDGSPLAVLAVNLTTFNGGLYNPQTLQGDIVVDGIIASTYTTAIAPKTAHALLAPLRGLFKTFRSTRNGILSN